MTEPIDYSGEGKKERRRKKKEYLCCCCNRTFAFCWTCPCGFSICQACMEENLWGMTCNNVTWTCPDCGEIRSY